MHTTTLESIEFPAGQAADTRGDSAPSINRGQPATTSWTLPIGGRFDGAPADMLILLLFFCSGATALVYEVIWSKYLSLMFGSTVQAQTVVLAVFMGGLALGNRLFGGVADRARQPLALYGYIEVTIGLYAFFFSTIDKVADGIYVGVGSHLLAQTGWLLLVKGAFSIALLLGPTILMGGTLPLLAAWLQKTSADAGRRSARFYSTNSLGAVFGAGMAGFVLVQALGLSTSLQMTALANVLVGFAAIGLARRHGSLPVTANRELAETNAVDGGRNAKVFKWGCILVTLTGGVSMGLEVLASRCLSLIFGASLQAFAIVLMAFILGIGLGAAVIASPRRKHWPRESTTIAMLLAAATLIGLVVFNIEGLVEIYRYARSGLAPTEMGFRYYQALTAVMSIVVLGLPAAALGTVLPLWIRVVAETSDLLGERVGRLLTWNTLGAVGGVLLTGFVFMPMIGLRGSFALLAMVLCVAAMGIAWAVGKRRAALLSGVALSGLTVIAATGGEGWRHVLSSGVFRRHETVVNVNAMAERRKDVKIRFYEDAPDATVSIEEGDVGAPNGQLKLRINGKVDATSQGDLATQYLMAHLPLMMKPDAKEVFVFGMGSGITAGAALQHPIEHLTVAENCKPVLRAARFFEPWNNGVLDSARTRIWPEDARTVLKLSPQKYDVIISEPSNPWMVGVGSVFSREFYEMAANRLTEDGLMVQWFHIYEMHDGIVALVMRTFSTVFPNMEIWDASEGDLILLGSRKPWRSDAAVYQKLFEREGPRQGLAKIGITTPEGIWARQFASQRTAFAIVDDGPIQQDDFPVLEYEAPKAFYMGQLAQRLHLFDERTWQSGIAPANKVDALRHLPQDALKGVFGGLYCTVNVELYSWLRTRFAGSPTDALPNGRQLPSIFSVPKPATLEAMLVGKTNEVERQILEAEAALQGDSEARAKGIATIENLLETAPSDRSAWSRGHYAGLAAKACLRAGDASRARSLLLTGFKREPDSQELQYLSRILVREGVLQPADVPARAGG